MANKKADRATLKGYFRKNLVPTESNFADLIDGMLNQADDGIDKPPGDPLRIAAAGDAAGPQKLINFYGNLGDPNPAWTLQLNPRSDQNDPATAKAGFSISDGQGASRLFIDRNTGNVGIGTIKPATQLHIVTKEGSDLAGLWGQHIALAATGIGGLTNSYGILHTWESDTLFIGLKDEGLNRKDAIIAFGDDPQESLRFLFSTNDASSPRELMRMTSGGNVGIGTIDPQGGLHIANSGKQWGSFNYGTNVIVKGGTPQRNPAIGIFDYKDENPWAIVNGDGNLQFVQMPARGDTTTAPINRLTIDKNGNVAGTGDLSITAGALDFGAKTRQMINLWSASNVNYYGIGVQSYTQYFRTNKNFAWYKGGAHTDAELDSGQGGTIQMVIKDGNVGIGTNNPEAKLDILASTTTWGGWYEAIRFSQSSHSAITHPGGGLLFGLHSDRRFYFADTVEGQYIMTIDANPAGGGNVGIGTTNPLQQLSITGGIGFANQNAADKKLYSPKDGVLEWMTQDGAGEHGFAVSHQGEQRVYLNTKGNSYLNGGNVGIGTTNPHETKLYVEGSIKSPMWNIYQLFDSHPGPLPLTSFKFTTGGGTLLIIASGSGWCTANNKKDEGIGMEIQIDGKFIGFAKSYSNENSSHKAFICNPLVKGDIAAGSHKITLKAMPETITDTADWFNVTVLEFPFKMPLIFMPFNPVVGTI